MISNVFNSLFCELWTIGELVTIIIAREFIENSLDNARCNAA